MSEGGTGSPDEMAHRISRRREFSSWSHEPNRMRLETTDIAAGKTAVSEGTNRKPARSEKGAERPSRASS
jgi:hypothetical protein